MNQRHHYYEDDRCKTRVAGPDPIYNMERNKTYYIGKGEECTRGVTKVPVWHTFVTGTHNLKIEHEGSNVTLKNVGNTGQYLGCALTNVSKKNASVIDCNAEGEGILGCKTQ